MRRLAAGNNSASLDTALTCSLPICSVTVRHASAAVLFLLTTLSKEAMFYRLCVYYFLSTYFSRSLRDGIGLEVRKKCQGRHKVKVKTGRTTMKSLISH